MTQPQDREAIAADAEKTRQEAQAAAADAQREAERDGAGFRARQAQAGQLDPNSPEGRQAAIRRGDPVQLRGDEEAAGMTRGTSTTVNESGAGYPANDDHSYVTGAAGMPVPASEVSEAQRPAVGGDSVEAQDPPAPGEVSGQRNLEGGQAPETAQPPSDAGAAVSGQDTGEHGPGTTQ